MKKIFLLLLLFSCVAKTPKWYIQPQQNTEEMLYGVGAAPNQEQAIEEALANLKEKIYTSVSSSKFIQDIVVNEKMANEYNNTIKLKTPEIPISNYNVVQTEERAGIFYTMVEVNRHSVGEVVNNMLEENAEELKAQFRLFYYTSDIIQKNFILEDVYKKCTKHLEVERFYTGLGYLFPDNTCTEVVKTRYNMPIEHPIQIVNSNPDLYPIIVNIFAKKFNITNDKNHIVSYKTDIKTENLSNGNYITGINVDIIQYNVPRVYKIKCVGSSSVSAKESINVAVNECLERTKSQSFEDFFEE